MGGATRFLQPEIRPSWYFNPRSPWGERRVQNRETPHNTIHFNPRSPWGERPAISRVFLLTPSFQSTLPVGGATRCCPAGWHRPTISIHAPRGGSDFAYQRFLESLAHFNPRSPWGERPGFKCSRDAERIFQSTLPVGGATVRGPYSPARKKHFNPRSPWGERLFKRGAVCVKLTFQSTLPVGGATRKPFWIIIFQNISIHAPRGGSDQSGDKRCFPWLRFQSTLPVGGATTKLPSANYSVEISIHAPRGGSDCRCSR